MQFQSRQTPAGPEGWFQEAYDAFLQAVEAMSEDERQPQIFLGGCALIALEDLRGYTAKDPQDFFERVHRRAIVILESHPQQQQLRPELIFVIYYLSAHVEAGILPESEATNLIGYLECRFLTVAPQRR